jgi:hypothetical protein
MGVELFSSQSSNGPIVAVSFVTQRIRNDVCLFRVIVNFQVVFFDQLEPPSLPHVQIWLGKDVLQAFVVYIDMNHIPK